MFHSSLAVWNLTEELFWHPRWNGGERRYAASQIVTPMLDNVNGGRCDYGKVVAVRCLYTNVDADLLNGYNPIQASIFPHPDHVSFNK